MGNISFDKLRILTKEQRAQFIEYLPDKVFRTERNVSILVAFTQLCMIVLFLTGSKGVFHNSRSIFYFSLYVFLLVSTVVALFMYTYTIHHRKYQAFLWIRRIYACLMCVWVLGITYLEQINGTGITVYYYLIPTMAAVLLLSPLESLFIFVGTWIALLCILLLVGNQQSVFGDIVNSIFVTMLTLFISYRYYRSMAIEFCDMQTISVQYQKIEKSNALLQKMAHIDQLTELYNRHYLLENLYQVFDVNKEKGYAGMFLMIDIDYFKQYNDQYGHVQGDVCIKALADVLKEHCAAYGVSPIRYGGEEFLMIKMNEESFDALAFTDELMKKVKAVNLKRCDVEFDRVTVSAGLWHGKLSSMAHIETAIKCCDDALYQAKSSGRNCIVEVTNN